MIFKYFITYTAEKLHLMFFFNSTMKVIEIKESKYKQYKFNFNKEVLTEEDNVRQIFTQNERWRFTALYCVEKKLIKYVIF